MTKVKKLDHLKDLEIYNIDKEKHKKEFIEWIKDKSRLKEFETIEIVGHNAIIEVFRVGLDEEKISKTTKYTSSGVVVDDIIYRQLIYPFAKILAVNTYTEGIFKGIKPGDIYLLPDSVMNVKYTEEYLSAVESEKSNKELVKTSNINATELNLNATMEGKRFFADKFSTLLKPQDYMTFKVRLQDNILEAKLNVGKWIKNN